MKKKKSILKAWRAWTDNYNKYFRKDYTGEKIMTIDELKIANKEYEEKINEMFKEINKKYNETMAKAYGIIEKEKIKVRNAYKFFTELEELIRKEGLYEKCFFNEEDLSIHTKLHDFHDYEVWCEKVMIADWKSPKECLELIKWLYK